MARTPDYVSSAGSGISVALSWENLSYRVGEREILKGLSGQALPSRTLAIMGSSGAGKTTFLNALCDRLESDNSHVVGGTRRLNEVEYNTHYRKLMGFVPQDDIVAATSTPVDALGFSLRIRRGTTREKTTAKVNEAISELKLENARNTIVGVPGLVVGLSGGERKRCNIGVELIADPKILLLDEPTSGLDSVTSSKIMQLVQELATRGRTVLYSIHQPTADCVACFDDLLLLCQGKAVYHGTMANAVGYFESIGYVCPSSSTPTDYFMTLMQDEVIAPILINAWEVHLQNPANITAHLVPVPPNATTEPETTRLLTDYCSARGSSYAIQFAELQRRAWLNVVRNKMYIGMSFSQVIFFAIVAGTIFADLKLNVQGIQDRTGLLFMVIANTAFSGAMMMVNTFPKEKAVFIREQQSGAYSPTIYFITKMVAELPIQIATILLGTIIIYFATGLYLGAGQFFLYLATVFAVYQATAGLGMLISAAIDSYVVAAGVTPLCIIPMMLAGGLLASTSRLEPYWVWLEHLSVVRYGFIILFKNEFNSLGAISCNPSDFNTSQVNGTAFCLAQPSTGPDEVTSFDLNDSYWSMWLSLILWIVICRFFCVLALIKVAQRKS